MKGVLSGSVLALCLLPALAAADPSFECSINSASQVEIAQCLTAAEDVVDQTLEAALQIATASAQELDDITARSLAVPALAKSQKAWTAYRDEHCRFIGSTFGGGSGAGIAIRSCRVELGRARVQQLMDSAY